MGSTSGVRRVRRSAMVIGVAVLAVVCASCATDLGSFGGTYGGASDINEAGTVVGYSEATPGKIHAFVKPAGGALVDLGTGSRTMSTAHAVNDAGVVVGATADRGSSLVQTPFVWTAGAGLVELALPTGAVSAWAADINGGGSVVVNSGNRSGAYKAWVYDQGKGTYTALPSLGGDAEAAAIAPGGTIVGWALTPGGVRHAVKWDPKTKAITDLDAGQAGPSAATAINSAGTIVGWSNDYGDAQLYQWVGGTRTTLGQGRAQDINEAGVIVGEAVTPDARTGHLWHPAAGISRDLIGLTAISTDATAINDHGVAVGVAADEGGQDRPVQFPAYAGV